jgi:hypothetical protein
LVILVTNPQRFHTHFSGGRHEEANVPFSHCTVIIIKCCHAFSHAGVYSGRKNQLLEPIGRQMNPIPHTLIIKNSFNLLGSRDSSVGIGTSYGLEGPGIESRWGEIFRTYPDRLRGHSASCTMGTGSSLGVKAAGA